MVGIGSAETERALSASVVRKVAAASMLWKALNRSAMSTVVQLSKRVRAPGEQGRDALEPARVSVKGRCGDQPFLG